MASSRCGSSLRSRGLTARSLSFVDSANATTAGPAAQVHRLRTDHDQRIAVIVQGVQGVEECAACLDEEVIAARLIHVPASIL